MARWSPHNLLSAPAGSKLVLLFCAAASAVAAAAAGGKVLTYSYPVFTAATTADLGASVSWASTSAASLFDADSMFKNSEGFLLLTDIIELRHDGRVASFNTSFTVAAAAAPVAFVVLRDSVPLTMDRPGRLRGAANHTLLAGTLVLTSTAAAGSLATVDVGPVMSYSPSTPADGLNVTVTLAPRGSGCAVWIEHDAAVGHLTVRVARAGEVRPAAPLQEVKLGGVGGWLRWTTDKAYVGFFGGKLKDVVSNVRDWELTVDRISGAPAASSEKTWLMIVMVSVSAIIV